MKKYTVEIDMKFYFFDSYNQAKAFCFKMGQKNIDDHIYINKKY